jgi:hypothetical protein
MNLTTVIEVGELTPEVSGGGRRGGGACCGEGGC